MNASNARQLRKNPTEAEQALWKHLRLCRLGEYKFRRQQPIGWYIVDFVNFEKRVVIELDGGQHSQQVDYDAERTAWLNAQGYLVLRFWNNQVMKEVEAVKAAILQVLEDGGNTTPHLISSPARGEEISPLAG